MNAQRKYHPDFNLTTYFVGQGLNTRITEEEYNELLDEYKAGGGREVQLDDNQWIIYISNVVSLDTLSKYAKKIMDNHKSYNEEEIKKKIVKLQDDLWKIQEITKHII